MNLLEVSRLRPRTPAGTGVSGLLDSVDGPESSVRCRSCRALSLAAVVDHAATCSALIMSVNLDLAQHLRSAGTGFACHDLCPRGSLPLAYPDACPAPHVVAPDSSRQLGSRGFTICSPISATAFTLVALTTGSGGLIIRHRARNILVLVAVSLTLLRGLPDYSEPAIALSHVPICSLWQASGGHHAAMQTIAMIASILSPSQNPFPRFHDLVCPARSSIILRPLVQSAYRALR